MKKLLLILLGTFLAFPAFAETWNSGSFEASPSNSDSASAGAGKIRDTRAQVQRRASVEHHWGDGDGTTDDNGLHRLGSARCYMSESAPTDLQDSHASASGVADYLNSSASQFSGEKDLDNSASNSADGIQDDVGHGRCWIDTDGADGRTNDECVGAADPSACCTAEDAGTCDLDDNKMYVYLGVAGDAGTPPTGLVAGWQEVAAVPDASGDDRATDDQILAGSHNLLYNGSFEATDGSGQTASFTVASCDTNGNTTVDDCASTVNVYPGLVVTGTDIPANTTVAQYSSSSAFVISNTAGGSTSGSTMTFYRGTPSGWDMDGGVVSSASTPVVTYVDPSGDTRWGDGYSVKVEGTTGTNQQIRQTLTNLAASTTYKVVARVAEVDSSDICRLNTTGADSDLGNQDSDGTSWQTLSGTFTTASSLDTVDINLITVASGDICNWDHVGVYQVGDTGADRDEVNYNPGASRVRTSRDIVADSTDCHASSYTTTPCNSGTTGLAVTVMPPAPGYIVLVDAKFPYELDNANAFCIARIHDGSSALDYGSFRRNDVASGFFDGEITLHASIINPAPGTPIVLTLDVIGVNCQLSGPAHSGVPTNAWIEAVMIPTR